MVRNGVTVGVVGFAGNTAGGFSDDQVSLLQTFAGQAAIAVDNARLLREIEQRDNELAESLELEDRHQRNSRADQLASRRSRHRPERHPA